MNSIDPVNPRGIADIKTSRLRKAILWGHDDLLVQAVSRLLEASKMWDVIRVLSNNGVDFLIGEVRRIHPDVIILCQEKMNDDFSLPARMLQENLCAKIVSMDLESNHMHVYTKQRVIVQGVSDLLSIIESPDPSGGILENELEPAS